MTEPVPAAEGAAKKPQFAIQRLYAKDISFEVPGAPAIFGQAWEADTNVQFSSGASKLSEAQYEVVLQLTVKTSLKGKVAYIAEVRFAGIFQIEGIEGPVLEHLLGAQCPSIIYPYARELISDLVNRGSFPQLNLQPMNFEAIFSDARRRREEQQQDAAAAKH